MRYKKFVRGFALAVSATMLLSVAGCGAEEKKPTFVGEKTKVPAYQTYLNEITPAAYSEVQGLHLEPGTYISIIGKDEASPFWKQVEKGALQAAEDLNKELGYTGNDKVKVLYNAPAKEENIDEQVNILDEELARYPDVVGIASIDQSACSVQFDLATENGIPVVAVDSGNSYPGIQCTVKTDNVDAARTVAFKLADAMEREGEVIVVAHDSKSETAKERTAGFLAELKENYPNIHVVETIYLDKLEEIKRAILAEKAAALPEEERASVMEDMSKEDILLYYLEKHPGVKGILGTNDATTKLAASAVDANKSENPVLVMGFDAGKDLIQKLKDGKVAGLAVQNPFGIGYASVIAAARTVLQIGNEAVVNTGYTWVTKENLEEKSIQKMVY